MFFTFRKMFFFPNMFYFFRNVFTFRKITTFPFSCNFEILKNIIIYNSRDFSGGKFKLIIEFNYFHN
jgi:hypothetical protein